MFFKKRSKSEKDLEQPKKVDLKRNARKEKRNPWGRSERLFVSVLFFGLALVSGVLGGAARSWKLPGLPRLSAPDLSFSETYVFDGTQMRDDNTNVALAEFQGKTKELSGVYGLYVKNLETGDSYGQFERETFEAASFIKLPVMAAMLIEIEEGRLELAGNYRLKESDRVGGAGSLRYVEEGTVVTYARLIELMGKESDNTAFVVARNILGDEKIKTVIGDLGMRNTSLEKNETTPVDIGRFFEKLWSGRIVQGKYKSLFMDSLTDTNFEDHLAAGIPDGTAVVHKYGREVHVVNDAGIVMGEEPYVVVIMSKGVIEPEADKVFPELSKIIFDYQN